MDLGEPPLRARHLMAPDVIAVAPGASLLDVHRLFVEEEIHGAPVVGEDGVVHGVLSTLDLLRAVHGAFDPGAAAKMFARMPEEFRDRMEALTAADAMSREIVMVGPDATAEEVAHVMLARRIHRVLVGEDRMIAGVLTSFDLLRAVSHGYPSTPGTSDAPYLAYQLER
jgi:CBS domain-containing protein